VLTVGVVHEFPVVREGVMAVLSSAPDISVVAECDTPAELEHRGGTLPDVVVLGVRLSDQARVEEARALVERRPEARVLVMASIGNLSHAHAAVSIGASGVVVMESEPSVVRQAVRRVGGGDAFVDPRLEVLSESLARGGREVTAPSYRLGRGQLEVLALVPEGLSNRQIAEKLGVPTDTVKARLARAMAKLGVRNRTEAAAIVVREGWGEAPRPGAGSPRGARRHFSEEMHPNGGCISEAGSR
jgi:DNA-binding NarL/FixJ family response regulator